jgi:hypothetical protein
MTPNLDKHVRPDEVGHFHIQPMEPTLRRHWVWGPVRYTSWQNLTQADGSPGTFRSLWLWRLQLYYGTSKCDPTRTTWMNTGQLDAPPTPGYVMTTLRSEMWACRIRSVPPNAAVWNGMGGA